MTKYFNRLNTILIGAPEALPHEIFKHLLESYLSDAKSIFKVRHHQFFVSSLLKIIRTHQDNPQVLWKSIADYLNQNLPLHRLDIKGDFALLLNTFLNFHPTLSSLLAHDLSQHLFSSPYLFSVPNELNHLLDYLGKHEDKNGVAEKSFANLLLIAPKSLREKTFNRISNIFKNRTSLSYPLQIGSALSRVHAIASPKLIQEVTAALATPTYRWETTEELELQISIFSTFARHLDLGTQKIFVGWYDVNGTLLASDAYLRMTASMKHALPYLAIEPAISLTQVLFVHAFYIDMKQLSLAACEALQSLVAIEPKHIAEKIKDIFVNIKVYDEGHFTVFDKLSVNYTSDLKREAIDYLFEILLKNKFIESWNTFAYKIEQDNINACIASIKTLYASLPDKKAQVIERLITTSCEPGKKLNRDSHTLKSDLIGKKKFNSLQKLVSTFLQRMSSDNNSRYHLEKIIALAGKNKQNKIIINFFKNLTAQNNELIHPIISIFIHDLYNILNDKLKDLFFKIFQQLYSDLDLSEQYKLIEFLGFISEPEIASKFVDTIKPIFSFNVDSIVKLNIRGLDFVKRVLSRDQSNAVLKTLHSMYPVKAPDDNDYQKRIVPYLYAITLFAENLSDEARKESVARLVKESLKTNDKNIRPNTHFIKAIAHCVNMTSANEKTNIISLLMPLFLSNEKEIKDYKVFKKIISAISLYAQVIIANLLLTAFSNAEMAASKEKIYFCLTKLLKVLPENHELQETIINEITEDGPSMDLKGKYRLQVNFIKQLKKLPADSARLKNIISTLLINESANLERYAIQELIALAISTENETLIRTLMINNIHNLRNLDTFCEASLHLIQLSGVMTHDYKERMGDYLKNIFNDRTIEKIGKHPHDLDYSLLAGRDNLILTQLLTIIPRYSLVIIRDLFQRYDLDTSDSLISIGIHRVLSRLYDDHHSDFEFLASEALSDWLIGPNDTRAANLVMLRKLLTIIDINSPLLANTLDGISDISKQMVIAQISGFIHNETPAMEAFARGALFELFSEWEKPFKEMILTKLMSLVLRNDFLMTDKLRYSFANLTQHIHTLKDTGVLKFIAKDAYSTKLMSTARHKYDDARMLLLSILSTFSYADSVKINKKIKNPDITNHVMRFLI